MRHWTGSDEWMELEHDPYTQQTKWVKFHDGKCTVRVTQPDALTWEMLEINKREANEWQDRGGWKKAKHGAVIAKVPTILDTQFKRAAGYDPTKGGAYDINKYNSFLDDIDYKHLRTGGGKIGKRKAMF